MAELKKAVFLDRDDTLIHDPGYLSDPEKVNPIEGAGEALRRLRSAGYLLFLFTNQSGIGRGYYELADAEACNRELERRLGLDPGFDGICIAPERPDEPLVYRKPSPRYILETMRERGLDPSEVWMVGDRDRDIEAGRRAGVRCARICPENHSGEEGSFSSVQAYTDWLLGSQSRSQK